MSTIVSLETTVGSWVVLTTTVLGGRRYSTRVKSVSDSGTRPAPTSPEHEALCHFTSDPLFAFKNHFDAVAALKAEEGSK